MAVEQELKDLMPTTATYANVASLDVYGKATGGTTVTFKCHLKLKRLDIATPDQRTSSLSGSAYMDDVYDVQKGAILTLPSGAQPKVISVSTFYDQNGPHHTTVEFEG